MTNKIQELRQRILIESDGEKALAKYLNNIATEFYDKGIQNGYDIVSNYEVLLLEKISERSNKGKITKFEISRIIEANGSPKQIVRDYIDINNIEIEEKEYDTNTGVELSTPLSRKNTKISKNTNLVIRDGFFSNLFDSSIGIFYGITKIFIEIFVSPFRALSRVIDGFSFGVKWGWNKGSNPVSKLYYVAYGSAVGSLKGFVNGVKHSFLTIGEGFEEIGEGFKNIGEAFNFGK